MTGLLPILQHAIGVDQFGRGSQYRNHFVAGPGHSDYQTCLEAVASGLMRHHQNSHVCGGNVFYVTDTGRAFVAEHSPQPPKLSRSQRRYKAFLDHDSGLPFREWLSSYGKLAT